MDNLKTLIKMKEVKVKVSVIDYIKKIIKHVEKYQNKLSEKQINDYLEENIKLMKKWNINKEDLKFFDLNDLIK